MPAGGFLWTPAAAYRGRPRKAAALRETATLTAQPESSRVRLNVNEINGWRAGTVSCLPAPLARLEEGVGLSTVPYLARGGSLSFKDGGLECRKAAGPGQGGRGGRSRAGTRGRAGQAGARCALGTAETAGAQGAGSGQASINNVVKNVGRQAAGLGEWPWVPCAILGGAEAGVCAREPPAGK